MLVGWFAHAAIQGWQKDRAEDVEVAVNPRLSCYSLVGHLQAPLEPLLAT